jgi:DNA-3-methyladenine glycosylase I
MQEKPFSGNIPNTLDFTRRGMMPTKNRCDWVGIGKPHYEHYHDSEWGVPVHDDIKHFEMLILEGAQAGLSWETILKRRAGYIKAFKNFDPVAVSKMTDTELEALRLNPEIIRNKLKIYSARKNALVFISIQKQFGSFDAYVWGFVNNSPKLNRPQTMQQLPTTSEESDALSKDLKKRGMSFVGSTIMYAYMQATGLIDDHLVTCFKATF